MAGLGRVATGQLRPVWGPILPYGITPWIALLAGGEMAEDKNEIDDLWIDLGGEG